jgi:hypothetical protein
VSLLQAWPIDLRLPIKIAHGIYDFFGMQSMADNE